VKILSLVFAACLAAAIWPAAAQVSVNINVPGLVQVAPPPPRFERPPPMRDGHAWVPGRWQWNGRDYVWMAGRWQAARRDYTYAPGQWVQADSGWRWREGDWRRAEGRQEGRNDRWDDRRDDRRHDRHDDRRHGGGDGYHCPPGQAKKGNC